MTESSGNNDEGQARRQRNLRSWAIAAILVALTAMFYAATIIRLGGSALNRAL